MALGSTPLIPPDRVLPGLNGRFDLSLFASAYGTARPAAVRPEAAPTQAPQVAKATSGTLGTQVDLLA
jgi:hypothetical protein